MMFLDPSRFLEEIPEGQLNEEGAGIPRRSASGAFTPSPPPTKQEPSSFVPAWKKTEPVQRPPVPSWEREKEMDYRLSVNEFKFFEGAAETVLKFDRYNLPGLSRTVKLTVKIEEASFQPVFNRLKGALHQLPSGKTISLNVRVSYTEKEITESELVSCDLAEYLDGRIDRVVPEYIRKKLKYKEGDKRRFVDVGTVLKDVDGLPGIRNVWDLLQSYFGDQFKHGKQVEYLADKHLAEFGSINLGIADGSILALVSGADECFFVWEMVNDENATYLWQAKYSQEQFTQGPALYDAEMRRVLGQIGSVSDVGRIKYKAGKPDGFSSFVHNNESEGFEVWVQRLNSQLGYLT
jgi:hypothetical protein